MDGVSEVQTDYSDHTATVTFDDTKAGVEAMKNALEKAGFPTEGEPVFLK